MASHRGLIAIVATMVMIISLAVDVRAADCTPADYIGSYTTCSAGFRNLIYYKDPASTCTGGVSAPPNQFNIPCDITCPSGQYLPLGASSEAGCTPCAQGQYSLGGGVRIEGSLWVNNTRGWAAVSNSQISFRSTCTNTRTGQTPPASECSKWQILSNSFAFSGRTDHNDETVLEATATFVRDGTITFEYRVDAERGFDFFGFDIDETSQLSRISQQLTYTKVTYQVAAGMHVFKWKYSKDFSISYGDDSAFVRMIEVTGTAFADASCTPCQAGSFAGSTGSSSCTPCPSNTMSANPGSASCTACGPNQFSFVGSTSCNNSAPCTSNDVAFYYTPCMANITRSQIFFYQQPKICSDTVNGAYVKPADRYSLPCAPCAPGWQRNSQTGQCEGCPTNYYSTGAGSTCQSCAAGYVGRRDFIWTNFEELPNAAIPADMGCYGECGTPGWRLGPSFIDSGVGHGAYVDTFFYLNLTVVSDNTVTFNLSFSCSQLCYISYMDQDVTGSNSSNPWLVQTRTYYSFFYANNVTYTANVPIAPGDHQLSFHFSKFDGTSISRNDLVKISGIQVRSVAASQGGAAACQPCQSGQYADPSTPYCLPTPPGTYSGPLATTPTPCPAGSYAEKPGSLSCAACGHGTTSLPGSAWCDESCTYRVDTDFSYDLKPLSRVGGDMYGPIQDPVTRRNYYLNVCTRDHTPTTCHDDDMLALSTPACLTDPWGFGLDLGRVTNFWPHPAGNGQGVTIIYTNSSADGPIPCRIRPPGSFTMITVPRTTNITFNCDPMAGYGYPEFLEEGSNSCTFNFVWDSLFGCPACDDSDWSYFYTDCVNGIQNKTFMWKDNPRKCHGGLPLPDPVSRECSIINQTPCPAGQYLLEECTNCPTGSYSLGGAKIVNYWQPAADLPEPFTTSSRGVVPYGPFVEISFTGISIQTPPNWQAMTATFNFIESGSLSINFLSLVGAGYTLTSRVDYEMPRVLTTHQLVGTWIEYVPAGTHTFTFNLTRSMFASTTVKSYFRLLNATAEGVARAASYCNLALPGTYVYSAAQIPAQCPVNTYQDRGGATSCKNVDAGKFSPAGSAIQLPMVQCGYNDYDATITGACSNGARTVTMNPKTPVTCSSGYRGGTFQVQCACGPGQFTDSVGNCRSCPDGQGFDSAARTCVTAPQGSAVTSILSIVKGKTTLPPMDTGFQGTKKRLTNDMDVQWYASCVGACGRPWAWGVDDLGYMIESGIQVGPAVSTFAFVVSMAQAGTLNLSYRRFAGAQAPFSIVIDGTLVYEDTASENTLTSRQVSLPLSAGPYHIIALIVTTNAGGLAYSSTRISDLTVTGTTAGATVITPCPAGSYSDGQRPCTACPVGTSSPAGAVSCTNCPANTFAAFTGSTECSSCLPYGSSEPGAALCTLTSRLNTTTASFDWRDLPATSATITSDQRVQGYPSVTVDAVNGMQQCWDGNGNSATYMCAFAPLISNTRSINYGTYLRTVAQTDFDKTITLTFTDGDICTVDSRVRRSTILRLVCPTFASSVTAAPIVSAVRDCVVELSWFTLSACTACTAKDYKPVATECVGREQTINYEVISDTCHSNEYTQPPSEVVKCFQIGVSIGVIVGVIIAVVLLVVGLIVFYIRHRKLSTEYQLLKEHAEGSFDDGQTQFGVDDEEEEGVTLDHLEDDDDGLRLPTAQTSAEDPHEEL